MDISVTGENGKQIRELDAPLAFGFDMAGKNVLGVVSVHDGELIPFEPHGKDRIIHCQEMMDYTKNNILVEAAQAMLAQANMQPTNVLALLFSTYAIIYEVEQTTPDTGLDNDYWLWVLMMLHNREFNITATTTEGGTITPVGVSKVKYDKNITYTITPSEGYAIADVIVDGKSVGAVSEYTFQRVKKNHTISVIFTEIPWQNPFTDISEDDRYYEDIEYVYENGLMIGTNTAGTLFSPDETLTRAMLVTILWRMEGCPGVNLVMPYTDMDEDEWYAEAVRWASAVGIVLGHGDGTFTPEAPITREQLAAILYRYEQYLGGGFVGMWMFPLRYEDAADVSEWAYEAICWLTMKDIYVTRADGQLDPGENATRAEAAAMLHRYCKVMSTEEST